MVKYSFYNPVNFSELRGFIEMGVLIVPWTFTGRSDNKKIEIYKRDISRLMSRVSPVRSPIVNSY